MDKYAREFIFGELAIPLYIQFNDPNFALKDTCSMKWYLKDSSFDNCITT
jgi:hypothetical protein